jgi:hypothetical protein
LPRLFVEPSPAINGIGPTMAASPREYSVVSKHESSPSSPAPRGKPRGDIVAPARHVVGDMEAKEK